LDSDHIWKGPHEERDPWREWIRKNILGGPEGYVFEDFDLVPWLVSRRYWRISDPIGKFMLIEKKYGNSIMETAQIRTFGLIDHTLRKGDPKRKRYMGFYLFQYPDEDPWKCTQVTVNSKTITIDEFKRFLTFDLDIPPYEFSYYFNK